MKNVIKMGMVEVSKDSEELGVQVSSAGRKGVRVELSTSLRRKCALIRQEFLSPRHDIVDL